MRREHMLPLDASKSYPGCNSGDCCTRSFNERTGTPSNQLTFPTARVLHVVLWCLRDKLSIRDVTELFLERGVQCTHGTVWAKQRTLRRCWPHDGAA